MAGTWTKQQTTTANNAATAGTSLVINCAATQFASTLIIAVCSSVASTLSITGWIRVDTLNITGAGTIAVFKLEHNTGGISSVTISSSASALLSAVFSEYVSNGVLSGISQRDNSGSLNNANGTAVSAQVNVFALNDLIICAVAYIGTTALTASALAAGFSQDGTTFGTAATSAGIFLFSNLNVGATGPILFTCTLSATPTNGPADTIASFLYSPVGSTNGYIGPANESIGGVFQP